MKKIKDSIYTYFYNKGYCGKQLQVRYEEFLRTSKILLFMILSFVVLFSLVGWWFIGNEKVAKIDMSNSYFELQSSIYENNDIIISIATVCNSMDGEIKKIKCVNNFVKEFFYYDTHNDESRIIRTPTDIINKGGCCRDYSVFYSSIFDLMGLKNKFIAEEKHVYLEIYGENNYTVDQQFLKIENKKYINN